MDKERVPAKPHEAYISEIRDILGPDVPRRSLFERYHPDPSWFERGIKGIESIHGINHEARVLIHQEVLSRIVAKQTGQPINHEALRLAAITHDVKRRDDGRDPLHGVRAADWLEDYFVGKYPDNTVATASYLSRWHVTTDELIPEMTSEIKIFKDADALDRIRIPTVLDTWESRQRNLNPKRLRHDASKDLLIVPAETLFMVSDTHRGRTERDVFDATLSDAVNIGLINK